MLKSIAYIGYGFVGKSCHKVFEHNAEAIIVDPKYSDIIIEDLSNLLPDLVFVSLNAPTLSDGRVDASIIYDVLQQLADIKYKEYVILKSTLPPLIVEDLARLYFDTGKLRLIYSPEFLSEEQWEEDSRNPKQIILAGNYKDCNDIRDIYKRHSHVGPFTRFTVTDFKTAALAKYAINSFLATKVVFMNQLYQLYGDIYGGHGQPENWKEFCSILENDTRLGFTHMKVPGPDGKFGYGGSCFLKDMSAIIGFDTNDRMTLIKEATEANTQIRLTGDLTYEKK